MDYEPYIGEVGVAAFGFVPENWAHCDGSLLPIAQNTALFSLLGTTYGGNGQTTFALPDLRGRTPVGDGQGPGLVDVPRGLRWGQETVTLQAAQMPQHTHALLAASTAARSDPLGASFAPTATRSYTSGTDGTFVLATLPAAGAGQPHENRQPYLAVTFAIALQGIYPSRP